MGFEVLLEGAELVGGVAREGDQFPADVLVGAELVVLIDIFGEAVDAMEEIAEEFGLVL